MELICQLWAGGGGQRARMDDAVPRGWGRVIRKLSCWVYGTNLSTLESVNFGLICQLWQAVEDNVPGWMTQFPRGLLTDT